MYRGVRRSDILTHTRFTLSLREIAKLTSTRPLSNESSTARLDSQSVTRDPQQGCLFVIDRRLFLRKISLTREGIIAF